MLKRWFGQAQRAYEFIHGEPMSDPAYIALSDIPAPILACLDDPAKAAALAERAETLRDWHDDEALENGNYENHCVVCNEFFLGYKRRQVCWVCNLRGVAQATKEETK